MRRYLLFFCLSVFTTTAFSQTTPTHNIKIKITPYVNSNIYLGAYYGNKQIIVDTAYLNEKSQGSFNNKYQLTDGLYFVISPDKKKLFDFLVTDGQQFDIIADTGKRNNVKFIGSPDNHLLQYYIKQTTTIAKKNELLTLSYKTVKTKSDSILLNDKLSSLSIQLDKLKDSIIKAEPKSATALLLILGKQPKLPKGSILKTKQDTLNAIKFIQRHYWDDVPLNDDRLLYTPFFENKIDTYYKYYVSPVSDSVINALQYMLLYARTGKQMYPYLLLKFTDQYFNPQHTGQNKVLLYLFNNFFLRGDTILLNPTAKKMLFDRVYQLLANQVGDKAPPLDMTDINGKLVSLYSISSPYTLIVFWDPTCPHCQKELPHLDSLYKARWKAIGIKIYCVNINNALIKEMKSFVNDKHFSNDWIFAYQTDEAQKAIAKQGVPNYLQLYDLADIPTLYLLDAEKHIIAKDLNIDQLDRLIQLKSKSLVK
jgi:thiol-disulfide isomerase/thioredoxin